MATSTQIAANLTKTNVKEPIQLKPEDLMGEVGSHHKIKLELLSLKKGEIPQNLYITDFTFSKEINAAKGTGTISFHYDLEEYLVIAKGDEFKISLGWVTDGKEYSEEYISGFFDKVSMKGHTITADITDKGVLLERESDVQITHTKTKEVIELVIKSCGLKPYVDIGKYGDPLIDFSAKSETEGATSADAAAGTVCGTGTCSASNCPGAYGEWFYSCFQNKCTSCGKTGTLVYGVGPVGLDICGGAPETDGPPDGMIICCSNKGGCDCDFDVTSGVPHQPNTPPLVRVSGPTRASRPANTAAGQKQQDPQAPESSPTKNKTCWDALLELTKGFEADYQIYVRMDTCYVVPVKAKDEILAVDSKKNLVYDTITLEEGLTTGTNTVWIYYGNPLNYSKAVVQNKILAEKYGEIVHEIKAPKINKAQAIARAKDWLNKSLRDSEFQIDCTVTGHPKYFIGKWCSFKYPARYVDDELYISRFNVKLNPTNPYSIDLTLGEYKPTVSAQEKAEDSQLAGIGKTAHEIRVWIDANIQYESYMNSRRSPEQVLQDKRGNCMDQSKLFVMLLAKAGYQAQMVCQRTCYTSRGAVPHCNVDININGQIVTGDTTCHKLNKV